MKKIWIDGKVYRGEYITHKYIKNMLKWGHLFNGYRPELYFYRDGVYYFKFDNGHRVISETLSVGDIIVKDNNGILVFRKDDLHQPFGSWYNIYLTKGLSFGKNLKRLRRTV